MHNNDVTNVSIDSIKIEYLVYEMSIIDTQENDGCISNYDTHMFISKIIFLGTIVMLFDFSHFLYIFIACRLNSQTPYFLLPMSAEISNSTPFVAYVSCIIKLHTLCCLCRLNSQTPYLLLPMSAEFSNFIPFVAYVSCILKLHTFSFCCLWN